MRDFTHKGVELPCGHQLVVPIEWPRPMGDVTGECATCGTAYRAVALPNDCVAMGPPEVIERDVRLELDDDGNVISATVRSTGEPKVSDVEEPRWRLPSPPP